MAFSPVCLCLYVQISFYKHTIHIVFRAQPRTSPEKAMATRSSTLAWKIPWMEEPGGLQSMGSLGVEHDWATSLSLFTFTHWRRKRQHTLVFLPGESQGWNLMGCHLWGRIESDTTETWLSSSGRGFPGSSAGKESSCAAGDPGSIPGSGRSTGEGIGYPLQYFWASLVAQLGKNPPAM